jgi:hypothetical protein
MAEQTATKKVCVALPLDTVNMLHTLSGVSNCTQAELITLALRVFEMGQQAQTKGGGLVITDQDGEPRTEIRLPYSQPFAVGPVGTFAVEGAFEGKAVKA